MEKATKSKIEKEAKVLHVAGQYVALEKLWRNIVESNAVTDTRDRRNIVYRSSFVCAVRKTTKLPLSQIGAIIGRDHTTCLHYMRNEEVNITQDAQYRIANLIVVKLVEDVVFKYAEDLEIDVLERMSTFGEESLDAVIEFNRQLWRERVRYDKEKLSALEKTNEYLIRKVDSSRKRISELEKEIEKMKPKFLT